MNESIISEIQRVFRNQQINQWQVAQCSVKVRKAKLKKLLALVNKYRPEIKKAIYQDYKKNGSEADLTEVLHITSEIKHAIKNLNAWMGPKSVPTPLALFGATGQIRYEPKGVVLIISPWNFPFSLSFGPVVSAIAAGNTVVLKPSELTPHSSALIKKMLGDIFTEDEVAVFEGGKDTATALLALPFNHIFFTGSPAVGKVVMSAAAKNLASVTLELGGKSPTIVDETADIKKAAQRIMWGKCMNSGQVCIAPDYVFVHQSKLDGFIAAVKKQLTIFYANNLAKEPSYSRMVNQHHYKRVKNYVADALAKGAKVEVGNAFLDDENYIAPTVLTNVSKEADLMQNEIFGPVLPVFAFTKIDEVIDEINAREKPLALYIYSKSNQNIEYVLKNTRAGNSCVNHNTVHFFNHNLPFGGANNSGIGKSHGHAGFLAFSNERGVLRQHIPNALEWLMPPYTKFSQKLIDFTIKYF